MLFFDERFNFIEAVDGGVMQQRVDASVGSAGSSLGFPVKAPKNGYVYVYVSNESDQDVYFDNLKVGITRGNIIEENHYYAYGLRIAAISSRKPGHVNEGILKNDHQYQGAFSEMDDDIGWNDFALRSYNPPGNPMILQGHWQFLPATSISMIVNNYKLKQLYKIPVVRPDFLKWKNLKKISICQIPFVFIKTLFYIESRIRLGHLIYQKRSCLHSLLIL